MFQVQAAPKIYASTPRRSGIMFEDPFFNYFSDDIDDQWTRTTDFTPSVSIGQSFILCLEVHRRPAGEHARVDVDALRRTLLRATSSTAKFCSRKVSQKLNFGSVSSA
jgi:hypothetical protein